MPNIGNRIEDARIVLKALNENYEEKVAARDYIELLRSNPHVFQFNFTATMTKERYCRCDAVETDDIHISEEKAAELAEQKA